jgi:hypothetical protein
MAYLRGWVRSRSSYLASGADVSSKIRYKVRDGGPRSRRPSRRRLSLYLPPQIVEGRTDLAAAVRDMTLESGVTVEVAVCGSAGAQLRILSSKHGSKQVSRLILRPHAGTRISLTTCLVDGNFELSAADSCPCPGSLQFAAPR